MLTTRDLALALLSLMVVFGISDGYQPARTQERGPRLVADNGGSFQELVLHFTPEVEQDVAPSYRDLLRAFEPTVKVWVVVSDRPHFERFRRLLARWKIARPARFQPVTVGRPITTWSRDRYSLLAEGPRRTLLVRPHPHRGPAPRVNDWQVPFALAKAAGSEVSVRKVPLVFDGGDLTTTPQFVFATSLLLARNAGGSLEDPAALVRWLRAHTGREPVLIGGADRTAVPQHHVGMFLTPIEGRTVLVGDVDAGLALLPAGAKLPLPVDRSAAARERFRRVARDLVDKGFTVKRVPLVPLSDGLTYLTYNNALLERRGDGKLHAYVPQFGIEDLDRTGREAYAREGVVVHPIDVSRVFHHNGTVRCLVNVLSRRDAVSRLCRHGSRPRTRSSPDERSWVGSTAPILLRAYLQTV